MGTEIYLQLGSVTLDWSKNSRGDDHGVLFQEGDQTHIHSEVTNYEYCKEHSIDTEPAERALVRPLKLTVSRLELLGFTMAAVKAEYEARAAEWLGYQIEVRDPGKAEAPAPLPFAEFIEFLARHPISALNTIYIDDFGPEDMARIQSRFTTDPAFDRIPSSGGIDGYSEAGCFGSLIGILHPYSVTNLLESNPIL